MPREYYRIHQAESINDLIIQLNNVLEKITIQLQRLEGLDNYTTKFYGDIAHTGTNVGFFSQTAAPQQAVIAPLSATPSDAEIQTAVNSIITTLETFGWTADA